MAAKVVDPRDAFNRRVFTLLRDNGFITLECWPAADSLFRKGKSWGLCGIADGEYRIYHSDLYPYEHTPLRVEVDIYNPEILEEVSSLFHSLGVRLILKGAD